MPTSHYLLIGSGRVSQHFQYYFSLEQLSFSVWRRGESLTKLQLLIKKASHILILISDQAIDHFIRDHLMDSHALKIHFSGSLHFEHAYGAHPLMTFNKTLYNQKKYESIPFVIDDDAPAFPDLLPALPNPHVRLQKALKAKYHALCVLSGNFSCLLWQKFFSSLEHEFGFPIEIGQPYFLQLMENLHQSYQSALTGPLVRADFVTMEKNMQALENDPFQTIYKAFVSCFSKLK